MSLLTALMTIYRAYEERKQFVIEESKLAENFLVLQTSLHYELETEEQLDIFQKWR